MFTVHDCGFEPIDHPPYEPDFAPSDYFLLPNMKKHLAGYQYQPDYNVIFCKEENFYITGIQALQHRQKKCVDGRGDHVKK